jgi:hypothetical protein
LADQRTYTADQVATAARELRQAAGSEPEELSTEDVLHMLNDEIRLLRERGFTDERIAGLLSGFDIDVTTEDLARLSPEAL